MMYNLNNKGANMLTLARSFGQQKPIDFHAEGVSKNRKITLNSNVTGGGTEKLDAYFWLPLCASTLNISPDIRDYVVVPVIGLFSGIPNTNGDAITKKELLRWDTFYGCPAYKTFKGKTTHIEHDYGKDIITTSRGVIFDSYIAPLKGYAGSHAKVIILAGFDRSKDPKLTDAILQRKINTYSVGATYSSYVCSISGESCNSTIQGKQGSRFTKEGLPPYMISNGQIAFRYLVNINGYEISAVSDPAFTTAVSDNIITP